MLFSTASVLLGAALSFTLPALAISNLKAIPLSADCSSYPAYNSSADTAGPWSVVADSTGYAPIDGLRVSIESFTNNGTDRYGFITLPKQSPYRGLIPNITLRCTKSNLQAQLRSDWVDVSIASKENWQNSFSFGLPEVGIPIQPYARIVNGTRVPGVFLGTKNSTLWKYKFNWGGNAGEYYILRWLETASSIVKRQDFPVIDDRDWTGYLRVAA